MSPCRRRRYGTNLPVQDLLTSQNDAFVTAELVGTNDDEDESAYYEKRETDTHWRCKATTKAGLFSCCKCFHACCCCCDEEPGRHEPDGPSRAKSASRSLWRALLMSQVNAGSRYCRGKRT